MNNGLSVITLLSSIVEFIIITLEKLDGEQINELG